MPPERASRALFRFWELHQQLGRVGPFEAIRGWEAVQRWFEIGFWYQIAIFITQRLFKIILSRPNPKLMTFSH